ncbi:MAG: hypothetical protein ABSF90_03750 [Syntrophobacteraceae bacterium]
MNRLPLDYETLARLCPRHHIRRLSLFGSTLLGGRRVDLRTPLDLSRHFRNEVIRTAEVQYAAG